MGRKNASGHFLGRIFQVNVLLRIPQFHREHPALALNERRPELPADLIRVNGGRHYYDAQVRPQDSLCLKNQCKGFVRGQASLVELVKYHGGDTFQSGVGHQHPAQDAFCQYLDAGFPGSPVLEPYPVTHLVPDPAAYKLGHPAGNLHGGDSPWLKHQYFPAAIGAFQHCQRQQCGFSGSRRCSDYETGIDGEASVHLVSYSVCGKIPCDVVQSEIHFVQ